MPRFERDPNVPSIHVSGFPPNTHPDDLRSVFGEFGEVRDVYIPRNFYTKEPRNFAYIQYAEAEQTEKAYVALQGADFQGRRLRLEWAKGSRRSAGEMRTRDDRGSHYGRDGGRDAARDTFRGDGTRRRSRSRSRSPPRRQRSRSPERRTGWDRAYPRAPRDEGRSHHRGPRDDDRRRDDYAPRYRSRSRSRSPPRRERSRSRDNGPRPSSRSRSPPRRDNRSPSPSHSRSRSRSKSPYTTSDAPMRDADDQE